MGPAVDVDGARLLSTEKTSMVAGEPCGQSVLRAGTLVYIGSTRGTKSTAELTAGFEAAQLVAGVAAFTPQESFRIYCTSGRARGAISGQPFLRIVVARCEPPRQVARLWAVFEHTPVHSGIAGHHYVDALAGFGGSGGPVWATAGPPGTQPRTLSSGSRGAGRRARRLFAGSEMLLAATAAWRLGFWHGGTGQACEPWSADGSHGGRAV